MVRVDILPRPWCFPHQQKKLGRALGPLRNEGNEMAQAILTSNGKVIPRCMLRRLRNDKLTNPVEIEKRKRFDLVIRHKLGDSAVFPSTKSHELNYGPDTNGNLCDLDDNSDTDEEDIEDTQVNQPMTDLIINSEVHLPQGEEMKAARVTERSTDEKGEIIGTYDENPILNTLMYDVEFPNGEIKEYGANIVVI